MCLLTLQLYLHSGVIQTRAYPRTTEGRRYAIRYGTIDSTISLAFAFLINASILILAAAAFHFAKNPQEGDVADIQVAYRWVLQECNGWFYALSAVQHLPGLTALSLHA